jgi:hypothetical protein
MVSLVALGASKAGISTGGRKNDAVYRHNVTTDATLITCGNSTAETRSLGCKYDVFLNHWVPRPCYDDEWVAEYQEDGSWGAYANEDLTRRLKIEEMEGSDFYYTSLRDHINYCVRDNPYARSHLFSPAPNHQPIPNAAVYQYPEDGTLLRRQ